MTEPKRIWVDFLAEVGQDEGFTEAVYEEPRDGAAPYISASYLLSEEVMERVAEAIDEAMEAPCDGTSTVESALEAIARAALEAALKEG